MNNARPSARQLAAFYDALRQAEQSARRVTCRRELEARRDAYLASLR